MKRFMLLVIAGLALASVGCASTSSRGVENVSWQSSPDQLGRVAVLIDLSEIGPESLREEKENEIEQILRTTFEPMQASHFVDGYMIDESLAHVPWSQASDYELIIAARDHDVDAIALVHVDRYVGSIAVGLMPLPGWSARTDVAYRLRVLDAHTGRVLADLRRHRKTGGYLGYSRRSYLARDLENDLAEVVSMAPGLR